MMERLGPGVGVGASEGPEGTGVAEGSTGVPVGLESGRVVYRAVDPLIRGPNISDCIHAVSDIDSIRTRLSYPASPFYGDAAGRRIAHALQRNGEARPPREDLRWLEPALGMAGYSIVRRE